MGLLNKKFSVIMLCAAMVLSGCAKTDEKAGNTSGGETTVYEFEPANEIKDGQPDIYVVLKVMTSQYWQDIIQGVADAGDELGCNIYVGGPESEGDWEGQERLLEEAVNEHDADGIVLAPASSAALVDITNEIYGKGIPIALVDTIINNESFDTCYMTDNLQAGELAAEEMLHQLRELGVSEDEKAEIAIQITSTSSQTVIDRLAGFNQYWSTNAPANWTVLDDVKLNDGNKDRAKQNCIDFIEQYPNLKGMFGCNNSSTVGFVNGINEKGVNNIALVGFDYADETAALIAKEAQHASTIVQNQYNMGYEGLKTVFSVLDGETVDYKFIDTGTVVINRDNQQEYEQSEAGDAK